MQLDQIQLSYLIDQDRILLKLGFGSADVAESKQEIRAYLTRRLLQQLWPVMMQAMAAQVTLDRPEAALASHELVQMEYQQAVTSMTDSGNFAQEYAEHERQWPMGETPLLLDTIKFHLNANQPLCIQLLPQKQGSIEIHLHSTAMHAFCKLLQEAEAHAGWGLRLILAASEKNYSVSRTLN